MGDAWNVDPASGHIRRHEHADLTVAECLQRALPLALALVAMDRGGLEADMVEMLHQLLGAMLGAAENQRQPIGIGSQRLLQDRRLQVLAGDEMHILFDLVGGLTRRRDFDLDRIGQIFAGKLGNQLRHGCGEEQRLTILRHQLGNLAQVVDEAEIEHLVSLVENEVASLCQRHRLARNKVEQAAGGRDENVDATGELFGLLVDRNATDDEADLERALLYEKLQVGRDLVHQFTGRCEHESANVARIGTSAIGYELFDHRQAERSGLAGARLRKTDEVMVFQDQRNGLSLDGRRLFETIGGECRHDVLGEAKLFESGQCIYLSGRQTLSPERQDAVPVSSGVKNPA